MVSCIGGSLPPGYGVAEFGVVARDMVMQLVVVRSEVMNAGLVLLIVTA